MDPSNFRLRLALDLWRTIAVPSLAFVAIIRFSKWNPGWLSVPAYISFMVLSTIARRQWTWLSQHREAQQLGAAPIPRVVGKWPGNIDILLKMMRDFKNSYTLDVYLRLFEEYRCTTLNLRILWTDTVRDTPRSVPCRLTVALTLTDHNDGSAAREIRACNRFQSLLEGQVAKGENVGNKPLSPLSCSFRRRETFLGQGIFNRDDEVSIALSQIIPVSCLFRVLAMENGLSLFPFPLGQPLTEHQHRAVARPFFARERISDFDTFEKFTSQTLSILSNLSSSNQACEAQDLYARFSIDAASEFLFGKNLETLSASLPVPGSTRMGPKGSATEDTWGSFVESFEMAQQEITRRARIGYYWPLFELFRDRNREHAHRIREWLDPLVKMALHEKEQSKFYGTRSPVGDKTFLQHLADSTDGEPALNDTHLRGTLMMIILDPVLVRDQLLSMLLAARDTVSAD